MWHDTLKSEHEASAKFSLHLVSVFVKINFHSELHDSLWPGSGNGPQTGRGEKTRCSVITGRPPTERWSGPVGKSMEECTVLDKMLCVPPRPTCLPCLCIAFQFGIGPW